MAKMTRDYKKYSYEFEFGATDLTIDAVINPDLGIKGEVVKIIVEIPNFTNVVTTVISMVNADANEIFADDPRAKNDDYDITLNANECIIMGKTGEKWTATLSGVSGGVGGTIALTVYARG